MNTLTYEEKSRRLTDETLEQQRYKSPLSTYYERACLTLEAAERFCHLPQPIRLGKSLEYVLSRASCPVEPHDILLGRFPEWVLSPEEEAYFAETVKAMGKYGYYTPDNGHTPLDWEEIMRVGIGGYAEKCASELEMRRNDGSPLYQVQFLEGALCVFRAFSRYIYRYADAAADAGMSDSAAVCRRIAEGAPESFLEAVQLVLMVTNIYSVYCVGANATTCCGRMDDYLLRFYLRDISTGVLTREEAGYIIDDFNCKAALPMGRGEHQLAGEDGVITGWERNPVYDAPTYVILGGYSHHGDHRENPLTRLFLERINPRLENPVYVLRRTENTLPEVMRLAADKMRQNSTLLLYNDETMIPSFEFSGVDRCDAVNYTIHGCNWPDLQGLNTYRVLHVALPDLIMKSIFAVDGTPRRSFSSMDEIYGAIRDSFSEILQSHYKMRAEERESVEVKSELRVSDCFKRGILEAAQSGYCSSKYPFVLNRLLNIATACDMLASLEDTVFGGKVDLNRMGEALQANFEGYDDVRRLCLDAPKYGHDDERADRHAQRLMTLLTDTVKEQSTNPETGEHHTYAPTVTITDMFYIEEGRRVGATPDGRLSGAPLSENLSPSRGQSNAVTSLINSVTRIPFDRISSGVLNVRLSPSMVSGEDGLSRLCAIIETYFRRGGMQLQLSVTDGDTLRAAQTDPDSYRDLMVRITGYSAVFVDMSHSAQEEIIARDSLS